MQSKNWGRMTALLVAASLTLAACGGGGGNDGSSPVTGGVGASPIITGTPDVGGEVIMSQTADPDSMAYFWRTSTYAATVLTQIYGGGLVEIGVDLLPHPHLAEAMPEVSEDGKTYTFKLRQGVKFHDGTEVTAEDLEFTYAILLSPDYAGPLKSNVSQVASVTALDKYTLQFVTKDVFAPFLYSAAGLPPMPKHLLEGVSVKDMAGLDFWMKNPVGAGPFKFVEWRTGEYLLVERFDGYFRTGEAGAYGGTVGPWVNRIRFKTIPDDNTAKAAMEAGELSLLTRLEGDDAEHFKQNYAGDFQMFEWNRMGYGYQTFNTTKFPTDHKEVRQALSHALNRETIALSLLNGQATVPPGFVPPTHWVYDSSIKGYGYDTEKAVKLMEQAGFTKNARGIWTKDGQEAKLNYVATAGSALVEGIALVSQQSWNALGFDVQLTMVDFNTLLDRHLKPGDFHVTFGGTNFTLDPQVSFYMFHSDNIRLDEKGVAQGTNRARYKNAEVDRLIDLGMRTVDQEERKAIYTEAQRLIVEDAPANWIYVNLYLDVAQKNLKGLVNLDGFGLFYSQTMAYTNQWFMNEK